MANVGRLGVSGDDLQAGHDLRGECGLYEKLPRETRVRAAESGADDTLHRSGCLIVITCATARDS